MSDKIYSSISVQYISFADVFSKFKTETLPLQKTEINHTITFKKSFKLF